MKIDSTNLKNYLNHPKTLKKAGRISRILAILLGILTIVSLLLLFAFIQPMLIGKGSMYLFVLLDELDDVIEGVLLMGLGSLLLAFLSLFLKRIDVKNNEEIS